MNRSMHRPPESIWTRRNVLVTAGALFLATACDLDPGRLRQPELPVPPETEKMQQFTRDMNELFPEYGMTLEYLRGGRYDSTYERYQIDSYYLVADMGTDPFAEGNNKYLEILRTAIRYAQGINTAQGFDDEILIPEQLRRVTQDPEWKLDDPLTIPPRDPTNYVRLAVRGVTEWAASRPVNPSEEPELYFVSRLGGAEELSLTPYSLVEDRSGSGAQEAYIHTVDVSARMLPPS